MLVSIVVPAYNVEKYIEDALESIRRQTYTNYEVIVIDDGSKDNTSNILDVFCAKDSRFSCYHVDNGGVSKARNIGLSHAKGDKIYFMDSDDYIEENLLETMINAGKSNDLEICGLYMEFTQNSRQVAISRNDQTISGYNNVATFLKQMSISDKGIYLDFLWNKLFSKHIIDLYRIKFNETINLGEDFLFVSEYMKFVGTIGITKECLYHYCCRNNPSLTGRFDKNELNRRRIMKQAFINLFDAFNISEEHKKTIYTIEGKNCIISMSKISLQTCKLSKKEKFYYLNGFLCKPEIDYILLYLQGRSGLKNTILKFLFAYRITFLLYYVFLLYSRRI